MMNKATNAGRRILSLVLTAGLLLGMMRYLPGPVAVHAESGCNHVHNEDCGYIEAAPCAHVHDEDCGEDGADCPHVHDEDCGYIEAAPCAHVHDEDCGGLADADSGGRSTQSPPLVSRASAISIDLDTVSIGDGMPGEWDANNPAGIITLTGAGPFTLTGSTDFGVDVTTPGDVSVTLSNVNINNDGFRCSPGSSVTLTLVGNSELKGSSGISNDSGNPLVINGGGTLNATGYNDGIRGDVTVSGGMVNASANINGIEGDVTVSGGTVNASGNGISGNGISGNGIRGNGIKGDVTVSGGTVNASSGNGNGINGDVRFEGAGAVNVTNGISNSFTVETTLSSFIWSVSGADVTTTPADLTGVDTFTLDHPGGGQQATVSLSVPTPPRPDPGPIPGPASGTSTGSSSRGSSSTAESTAVTRRAVAAEHLGGYSWRVDLPVLGFVEASVDGDTLTRGEEYTVRSGSTILTLADSYVNSLRPGSHTLRMEFLSATATIDFTVTPIGAGSSTTGEPDAPVLADNGNDNMNPSTGADPALLPLPNHDPGPGFLRSCGIALAVLLAILSLGAAVPRETDDAAGR